MALELFKLMGTVAIDKNQALRDMKVVQDQAQRASKEMGRSFAKFTADHSAQFKKVGMISAAAGAVIALAVKKMRGSFNEYESALVDMGKITDESLESIQARMKELPPILGSLTDLTKGYYQIVSAGIKEPVEATNTLTVAAQTAAAAHMNQSDVVKGLTKVMEGYQGRIENVSEAADLMFAIEKEGQTTVGELIPVIGSLATMSANLKISQDEMGASMAVITKTAGSTAEAATEYEGVLTGLMKPTDAMTAAINKMEFATAEAAIEELGFVEVLRRLDEATGGSSEALGELFGRKQAILGVSKLTANGMITLSDTIDSVAGKAGSADKAYKAWAETGEALNTTTKNVTENLLILIGDALDPMLDALQERLTATIELMGEWVEANAPLAASIAQLGAGFGMFLIPFGAFMMMLPGMVLAAPTIIAFIGALSAKFALLAISIGLSTGGLTLLLAGIAAIVLYVSNEWKQAIEEGRRVAEAETAAIITQGKAHERLREAYKLTNEEMQYWIENNKLSASVLARVRGEANKLTEAKYGLLKVGGDVSDLMYEMRSRGEWLGESILEAAHSFEALDSAISIAIITGKELTEQQEEYMALRQRMSDVDKTATQIKLDDLDRESIALIANMKTNLMTMEQIDEYRQVMRQHIIAESSERMEYLDNVEEMERRVFELTHTWGETAIRDLDLKRDKLIEVAKSARLSSELEATAVAEIIRYYKLERAALDELIRKKIEAENQNAELEASYKGLIDRIHELTHTPMEVAIKKLDEQKQKYIDLGHAKKKIIEWYDLEIAKIKELYPELDILKKKEKDAGETGKEAGEEVVKSWTMVGGTIQRATVSLSNFTREGVAAAIAGIKMKFYPAIQSLSENIANLFGKLGVDGYNLARYYERQIEELTRSMNEQIQTILYGYDQYKEVITGLGGAYDDLAESAARSGGSMVSSWNSVAKAADRVAGAVEGVTATAPGAWGTTRAVQPFERGGGVDSVLIRATPGEHVIDKPMVDFVKRTGAIPSQLTKSIISGRPATSPSMQKGGMVGVGLSREIKYNIGPIYVEGDGDVGKIRRAIKQALDDSNLEILRSGSEVIPGVD